MADITVNGERKLKGSVEIQGSKNSSLPILAAAVLVNGISVIHNCPVLSDVDAAIKILSYLGCKVKRESHTVTVDSRNITEYTIPENLMREMRSSIVFLGSILGRTGKARLSAPGGCEIGLRPIDLHLKSLKSLGAEITEKHGTIDCSLSKKESTVITLSFPSVGATENIILASSVGKGRTIILNPAREPEIDDLCSFLNKAGCKIEINKNGSIIIDSVEKTHDVEHRVIPDRIVALTYMSALCSAGGEGVFYNVNTSHFLSALSVFHSAGCEIKDYKNTVKIRADKRLKAVRDIRTLPYPGFPTDAQAPIMAMLLKAQGTSIIVENIFENRFKHVPELIKMGAKIKTEDRVAIIEGVNELYGARVNCTDLRGGGALIVASLGAKGQSTISSVKHILRGYENIEECLRNLGADIK